VQSSDVYFNHSVSFLFIIIITTTVMKFSLDGSSPYTNTDKTNKNKYT
jgi:hypothetical protein